MSSWVQEGSVEGSVDGSRVARAVSCRTRGLDENRTRYTTDGPGCRAIYPQEALWVRRMKLLKEAATPSRPGPKRGARAAAGLCPFLGPPPSEHCPSFTTPDSLFILDTFHLLDTLFLLLMLNKSLSEA